MDLSPFFLTKSQAKDFVSGIDAIVDKLYTTTFDLEKSFTEQFGMDKKDILMKLLQKENISLTSNSAVETFLKKVQESIANLPVIELTVAFQPTKETLNALSEWIHTTLKTQFLLDIHVDDSLIAGAIITYKGKSKNYSIKQTFDAIATQQTLTTSTPTNPN